MSEQSNFFNSINGDRPYDAEDFAAYFAKFFTNGIFNNGLQVIAGEGMTVNLLDGMANVNGYRYKNVSNKILNIANADGALNRIDNIVIRLNLPDRKITAEVIQGEFSTEAVAPELVRDNSIYDLRIAEVSIPAGTTEIKQELIKDTRLITNDCGNVICAVQTPNFDNILLQYEKIWNTLINEQTEGYNTWFNATKTSYLNWFEPKENEFNNWEQEQKRIFDEWFETIKEKLSGDIAAKLLEDVENLQKTKAEKEELPTQEEKTKWNKATNDYTDLNNKPSINGVELSGDKKTKDLKLSYNDINDTPKNLSDFANDILIQSDSEESAIASSTGDTKKMYYWVEE